MSAVAPALATSRPWGRAAAWLAFLAPFFYLSYGAANHLASQQADVPSLVFAWEHAIPFLAWTILPYWSVNAFYGASLFVARSKHEVDAHEVEEDARVPLPPQRRQAMADLLEAGAEAVREQLDVVADLARGAEEGLVGQQHRGREVVGERDPRQRARLGAAERRIVGDRIDQLALVQERDLVRELEVARPAAQHLGEPELAALRIEAA